jgi:hypothetical protein
LGVRMIGVGKVPGAAAAGAPMVAVGVVTGAAIGAGAGAVVTAGAAGAGAGATAGAAGAAAGAPGSPSVLLGKVPPDNVLLGSVCAMAGPHAAIAAMAATTSGEQR